MTKPQHQGSLHDQLIELVQLANTNGLYDAADAVERSREQIEQIAAWLDGQAAKEQELIDSGRCNNRQRAQERWLVYRAIAMDIREGAWRKKKP